MYILTILMFPLKTYVIGLRNLISMNIFFTMKDHTRFFFISNTYLSNARLILTKIQAISKKHPGAKLLLFENYSLCSFMLPSKNKRKYSKKCTKNKCICFNEVI